MQAGVSVIICCYNGAKRLEATLKHLALQEVPNDLHWEVIVVDNASMDDSAKVAKRLWDLMKTSTELSVLTEPLPGKNFAFQTGIKSAKYELVLTCDDDNWLYPDYIAKCYRIMQDDRQIGALGGCGIFEPEQPYNPDILPYKVSYVNGPQTWADTDHWVYGAGSVYRKGILNIINQAQWKPITTGRKGDSLTSGEDVEFCFIIYLLGYKVVADPSLLFKHFVPLKRQNKRYILKLVFGQAYSYILLFGYLKVMKDQHLPTKTDMRTLLFQTIKGFIYTARIYLKSKLLLQPVPFEQKKLLYSQLGTIWSLIRNQTLVIKYSSNLAKLIKYSEPSR